MGREGQFRAVSASGMLLRDPRAVTALALIFETVHFPLHVAFINSLLEQLRGALLLDRIPDDVFSVNMRWIDRGSNDPRPERIDEFLNYITHCAHFAAVNAELFKARVFESEALGAPNLPIQAQVDSTLRSGEKNVFVVPVPEAEQQFVSFLANGYIPVVADCYNATANTEADFDATYLAATLAMSSVELLFPPMKGAPAEIILEARERLRDHLPLLWSSMLKLSLELKKQSSQISSSRELNKEAKQLVDTTVRPALIELRSKMDFERKHFFYKILSPVAEGLRVVAGNSVASLSQLLTNGLALGASVALGAAGHLHQIESLKQTSGLTFLLKLGDVIERPGKELS